MGLDLGECIRCHKESILISSVLGVCVDCICAHFKEIRSHLEKVHAGSRAKFGLPHKPPQAEGGLKCNTCVNGCLIAEGERGYCGVRLNEGGKFAGGRASEGNLSWYFDRLPTNCVADWVCPAGTEAGYPQFSHSDAPEYSYKNLAVFFQACSFNCLYCQNWHYREESAGPGRLGPAALAAEVDERTSCICYFGGDPTPQLAFALEASRKALEKRKDRILRICWETNGSMNARLLEKMAGLSLKSGGCIKFDLKAWHEELNIALCSVTNRRTLSNFAFLTKYISERPEPPFLVASTLLVPGYVDEEEVGKIAGFIASLDPDIPYSLLAFYPCFFMRDLPTTSRKHARRCREVAYEAGLRRVRIGNLQLLGDAY